MAIFLSIKHLYSASKLYMILFLLFLNFSCTSFYNETYKKPDLVDENPSMNLKKVHKKLFYSTKKGVAIGHQDATSYGVGWKYDENKKTVTSDAEQVSGSLPAVYGFDIGHIELNNEYNLDSVSFDSMRNLIIKAHNQGGLITISWHLDNPVTAGNSWDKTPAVSKILKDEKYKVKYELWIERVADFFKSLKVNNELVPIIFRPFHEMNGSWFWWGEGNCSATDYKTLWQETVKLLRDKHNLHNLLYVYSPNKLNPEDDYMKYYPGDEYVDILGIDIYDFNDSEAFAKSVVNDLNIVKSIANKKNKLFAFTETGLEGVKTQNWFTEIVYPNIENTGASWILFWRNANKKHHYLPYKGHHNASDFKAFKEKPKTLFLEDLSN